MLGHVADVAGRLAPVVPHRRDHLRRHALALARLEHVAAHDHGRARCGRDADDDARDDEGDARSASQGHATRAFIYT